MVVSLRLRCGLQVSPEQLIALEGPNGNGASEGHEPSYLPTFNDSLYGSVMSGTEESLMLEVTIFPLSRSIQGYEEHMRSLASLP